ncbi:MAG: prepilin-type N-terminal cleavage/methylation domain-containing protein [Planctomycetes bacterium]|nr:prepilin-type N-terminal cleavage/methylation domain-containing protein [Planctomycetota bacterium]
MRAARNSLTRGFTLVEVLIVVVILVILAAIAIPQFTQASDLARASALVVNVRHVRSQIQLYTLQHGSTLPSRQLVNQLTLHSNAGGQTCAEPSPDYPLGPYLLTFPENPITGIGTIKFRTRADQTFSPPKTDAGWWYNLATGEFRADLTQVWQDETGTPLNQK